MIVRPFRLVVHWYHIRSAVFMAALYPAYRAQVLSKESRFTEFQKVGSKNSMLQPWEYSRQVLERLSMML